jgi:hypothetical protein
MSLVMVFAVVAIRGGPKTLVVALLLLTPALAVRWANHVRPDLVPREIFFIGSIVFVTAFTYRLLAARMTTTNSKSATP